MRQPMMAANWKMHKTTRDAAVLAGDIAARARQGDVEIVLAPAFTSLQAVANVVAGTGIEVAAQDMHWADEGPYTGAVSPGMVREWAQRVILGHSERRTLFGETDEQVNRKVHAAYAHGLRPIVCVGETAAQREKGDTDAVVRRQVSAATLGLAADEAGALVIAYEPVWAIGTGQACQPEEAARVAARLRRCLDESHPGAGQTARILYGGSMKPDNVAGFMRAEGIDGGLVGGASLRAESFAALVGAAAGA